MFLFKTFIVIDLIINCASANLKQDCNLPRELLDEIHSYESIVNQIIDITTKGKLRGETYNELAKFVDKFGSRFVGSTNLEDSIDYMIDLQKSYDLNNVHGEEVIVPHWIRGEASASLIEPLQRKLPILPLITSVGTQSEGIVAEALVVESFDELDQVSPLAHGKIVVFNNQFVSYGESGQYRGYGASKAAQHGAVATLIRSVTPFSMQTLHAGYQQYQDNITKIPTASITIEDARMLQRMQGRGERILISLRIKTTTLPDTISRNTVSEVIGSTKPEQVVIISGHIDTVDVGEGAMDDGGGSFISWYSLVVLKALGLKPKRTVRAILWTAEEVGGIGAIQYNLSHSDEISNINFAMESDLGTFNPQGILYMAGPEGACILQEIMKLLSPINATQALNPGSDEAAYLTTWTNIGIPGATLLNDNDKYFWFHHSVADTMDVEDAGALDRATALWASVAYVIADLSIDFPREGINIL